MTMVMVTMVSVNVCENSGLGPRGLGHETMKMTMIMKVVVVMMVMTVQVVVMMMVCMLPCVHVHDDGDHVYVVFV